MPHFSPGRESQLPSASSSRRQPRRRRAPRDRSRRFAVGLVAVLTTVSLLLGWGLASLSQAAPLVRGPQQETPTRIVQADVVEPAVADTSGDFPRTVDYIPEGYRLAQRLYLENCATCHIGVPPATLPSESWRNLIQDSSHYGSEIQPPLDPSRGLIWSYLRSFSRQKSSLEARAPYRLGRSRYFKALHPNVALPADISLESCASCHVAAQQFSFRPWDVEGAKP